MNKTPIEWVRNPDGTPGYTWNPITGCLNGCDYCYARRLANTRLKERYLANKNVAPLTEETKHWYHDFGKDGYVDSRYDGPFYPRLWPERIDEPYAGKTAMGKPKGIFVCDMSDLFGIGIPENWTRQVINRCRMSSPHRFYLLTKQPQNLIKFSPFPDNCWVGVSAWDESSLVEAYNELIRIKARTKYISLEPFLGWGRLYEKHACKLSFLFGNRYDYPNNGIDWVIIGAQTKPTIMPKIEWVREITEACDKARIPVFHKNNPKPLFPIPTNTLRQEIPDA